MVYKRQHVTKRCTVIAARVFSISFGLCSSETATMFKKKEKPILSDKIASLIAPKKLLDPEIDSDDETAARNFDYELENESDTEALAFSDIRKKNVKLLHDVDAKYRGKVASRKDFDMESLDEEESEDDEDDSETEEQEAQDSNEAEQITKRLTPAQRIKLAQEAATASDDEVIDFDEDSDGSDVADDLKSFRNKLKKSSGNAMADVKWDEESEEEEEGVEDEEGEDEEEGGDLEEEVEGEEDDGSNGSDLDEDSDDGEDDDDENESDFDGGDIMPQASKASAPQSEVGNILPKVKTDEQLRKGLCVQNQLQIWEKLLEVRIHSQKMLLKANSLPCYEKFQELKKDDSEYAELAQTAEANLLALTSSMCDLQKVLLSRYPETKEIASKRKSLGKIDGSEEKRARLDECLQNDYSNFKEYQYSVISKWHDRTKLLTPGSIKTQKQQGNTDILRKIDGVLANREQLVKKSQQIKGTYDLFDQSHTTTEQKQNPDQQGAADDNEANTNERSVYCTEIYDDTDFYHTQLRELIEYKSNVSTDANEMVQQFNELQRLRKRMKKDVDTRASKGRKIRYVVHNKLVSFMAPNEPSNWTSDQKGELFKSLFGAQT